MFNLYRTIQELGRSQVGQGDDDCVVSYDELGVHIAVNGIRPSAHIP